MSKNSYEVAELALDSGSSEKYRPRYHYTSKRDWLSDPNGMVYFDGEYHLCYQHDRYNQVFSGMSWGHAVSKDLLDWCELPKPIQADEKLGMCFSGCLVVDENNTSGLGENALVGFYTSELPKQQQSMFYSTDRGRTFTKYEDNPVIPNTEVMSPDFRDPKVFWYAPRAVWVMALAGPERIEFWSSENLIEWQFQSCFGEGQGAHEGEWECPDLRLMPVDDNEDNMRWVLLVSVNPGGPNGGSGTQYFIGDFGEQNGKLGFYSDQTEVKWFDYGSDNYAGVGWSNLQDSAFQKKVISIGWLNNWTYAYRTPTNKWRGVMTLIRELKLETFRSELLLTCRPASIYDQLMGRSLLAPSLLEMNKPIKVGNKMSASLLEIEFELNDAQDVGIELTNKSGHTTRIGYRKSDDVFYVDRRRSGDVEFSEGFAAEHVAHAKLKYDRVTLEIYIDRCSVEVFFNRGEYAMSELIFPQKPLSILQAYGLDGCSIANFELRRIHKIKKIT